MSSFDIPSTLPITVPPSAAVATTTLGDLINQVHGYLLSGQRVERNRLTSSIDDNDTSLAFDFTNESIATGAKLSIDFEEIHVWTGSGNAANPVQRGEFGSTAASHSAGSIVHINAEWSNFAILRELNNELDGLSGEGLYRVAFIDITYNAANIGYDLGVADLIDVIEIRTHAPTSSQDWPLVRGWDLLPNQDPDDFGSGNALQIWDAAYVGQPMRVWYKVAFSKFSTTPSLTDVVQTVTGLHGQAHDLLAMGAALRLAGVAEIARNRTGSQGDTRRATEVTPGARNAAPIGLERKYMRRLMAEQNRLHRLFPARLKR